ncbi:uncharacterized protein PgNI_00534 [Pyricularia grisea]|uniref:Ecp2 effector protein-like domain-containing protein n=1 Tax=Pyricularia grisea TaxID=148305 RepID=A0A6P8BLG2_PYRGI|nr:uncharacterized protein PgNI_00534 [Pyricularia grisea]TLD17447.1 hypothetical protein PgNI_00534 [Pyricularia grisea]
MKLNTTLSLVSGILSNLTMALPPVNVTRPGNITAGNDVLAPPQSYCKATSFFTRREPYASMRQDDCLNLAASKLGDPQGAWILSPKKSNNDHHTIGLYNSCNFHVQRADDRLGYVKIGAEDVFQAIIAGSQRYVNDKMMADPISGMTSCHGGPVRWLLTSKVNPRG